MHGDGSFASFLSGVIYLAVLRFDISFLTVSDVTITEIRGELGCMKNTITF